MIHVRTKEFLLVIVVVVVVETLCLRRFVYRHKGVNHRQAAVESVKEGERGKRGGEKEGERESRAHPREEVQDAIAWPRASRESRILPSSLSFSYSRCVSLFSRGIKRNVHLYTFPHKRRLNGRFRVHETAKRTSLLFRSVLDCLTPLSYPSLSAHLSPSPSVLVFFPSFLPFFPSSFFVPLLFCFCRYPTGARRFVRAISPNRVRVTEHTTGTMDFQAYLRSYWPIFFGENTVETTRANRGTGANVACVASSPDFLMLRHSRRLLWPAPSVGCLASWFQRRPLVK